MKILNTIVTFLSGEFFLSWYPNGGTVVLLRTFFTSIIIYILFITAKGLLDTGFGPELDWVYIQELIGDTLTIAGAIIAGTYTAFYTRFASQWAYLAELYNNLMSTQAQVPRDGSEERERVYAVWKAGIVEDAYTLHLAGKPMFAPLIAGLLEEPKVVESFLESAYNGSKALEKLEKQLSSSLGKVITVKRPGK